MYEAAEQSGVSVYGKKAIACLLESWEKFDDAIFIHKNIIAANAMDMGVKRDLALAYYQKGAYQQSVDMYYTIITSDSRYGNYDPDQAVRFAAMDEMNAVIAIYKDILNLGKINLNLVRSLPVD